MNRAPRTLEEAIELAARALELVAHMLDHQSPKIAGRDLSIVTLLRGVVADALGKLAPWREAERNGRPD